MMTEWARLARRGIEALERIAKALEEGNRARAAGRETFTIDLDEAIPVDAVHFANDPECMCRRCRSLEVSNGRS